MNDRLHGPFAAFTRWVNDALASPWALAVALALVAGYILVGPYVGLPEPTIDLSFLITLSTFVLVFLIEHQGNRDRAAMQVKLDELLRVVEHADERKIGIEERHPREIDAVRDRTIDETRERGRRRVG